MIAALSCVAENPATLTDIQTGNHVTVTYETPGGTLTARQIAQTSIEFTGILTAIDLGEKTLKAKALFGSKKFNVADDCAIIINGRTGGQLSDLKPNDKLVFSYDEINGVNVVNRIAPAMETQPGSVAAASVADDGLLRTFGRHILRRPFLARPESFGFVSGRAFDFTLTLPGVASICANRPVVRVKDNSSRPQMRRSSSRSLPWRCRQISFRRCHIPRKRRASR